MRICYSLGLLLISQVKATFDGSRISGSLLKVVEQAPCVRLFHSKGSIGCRTATHEGTTVPLYMLESFSAADQQKLKGLKRSSAVVISSDLLNGTVLSFLAARPLTKAVLVLEDWDQSYLVQGSFSPDSKTPHGDGTPDSTYTMGSSYNWNTHGNGMIYAAYDFPIILVTGESVANVKSWARQNGQLGSMNYPVWTALLDFYFGPSGVTSKSCLRWKDVDGQLTPQCLPLGGQSVWASLGGRTGLKSKSTVLLTAGMDSLSLFHDKTPGANEAASSIIAILAAVDALSASGLALSSLDKNIAVALFQADEWAFAGSRRFVTDISSFSCSNRVSPSSSRDGSGSCLDPAYPSLAFWDLSLANIEHVMAVDQVGLGSSIAAIYSSTQTSPTALLSSLTKAAAATTTVTYSTSTSSAALPPTPLTTFLNANSSLSGVVVAGYSTAFEDPRYHSHMDNASFLDKTAIAEVSTFLARSIYSAAGGADSDLTSIAANSTLVDRLVACLTEDWTCGLMSPYTSSETDNLVAYLGRPVYVPAPPATPSFYSSIIGSYQSLPLVQVSGSQGVSNIYGRWGGGYKVDTDRIYTTPKPLEAFIRGFLAKTISKSDTSSFQGGACSQDSDCSSNSCDGGLSTMECLAGVCVCRTLAFYHTALDPGLKPAQTPDQFEIVDATSPNWAEPNWMTIGMSVYPDTSEEMENTAISVGVVVLCLSFVAAFGVQAFLSKNNILQSTHTTL